MSKKLDIGYRVTFGHSVSSVDSEQWDACAGTDNPFVSHAFLSRIVEKRAAEMDWLTECLVDATTHKDDFS